MLELILLYKRYRSHGHSSLFLDVVGTLFLVIMGIIYIFQDKIKRNESPDE